MGLAPVTSSKLVFGHSIWIWLNYSNESESQDFLWKCWNKYVLFSPADTNEEAWTLGVLEHF